MVEHERRDDAVVRPVCERQPLRERRNELDREVPPAGFALRSSERPFVRVDTDDVDVGVKALDQ